MLSARSRSPFTASQWQELERQALVFKYMVSGVPIPPDLILPIKQGLDYSISSRIFPHQPMEWGCFQMGFGRKADPEPGRCRRTDGKKWRCSKEVFPDSKYCERHMHRGRNRSRKPVEVITTPFSSITRTPSSSAATTTPSSSSLPSSMAAETNHQHHHPYCSTSLHSFIYPHSSSSRPPGIGFLHENNSTQLVLDSGSSCSLPDKAYRHFHGLKEEVDEHAFFSEASGTLRSLPDSTLYNSWQLRQRNCSVTQSDNSQLQSQSLSDLSKEHQKQHCFVLGTDFKSESVGKVEKEEKPQQPLRHFFDEWPPKGRSSWFDSEDDRLKKAASLSTTQLSISIPMSSPEFPISNSRSPQW